MRKLKNILVTGGCGFIGSNFINYLFGFSASGASEFTDSGFTGKVVNADCLTYAANPENLSIVEKQFGGTRYFFEKVDICDKQEIERIFKQYDIDTVVHFAAETHVDRSISGPDAFIRTNVQGTFVLLEAARNYWQVSLDNPKQDFLFHYISTDEVYGSLGHEGYFTEQSPYAPRSPYSASKASAEHLVMSYFHTFGLPVTISNCSNNYGPYQFTEKFIPLMITNILEGKKLPVYGKGENIRDWIYVEDHNSAVWQIVNRGVSGEKYNIGGENEWQNIKLLNKIIELTARATSETSAAVSDKIAQDKIAQIEKTIEFVKDRQGHDARYAIDCTKIKSLLGWERKISFEQGLKLTINYYLN